jgi:hypothetical protein
MRKYSAIASNYIAELDKKGPIEKQSISFVIQQQINNTGAMATIAHVVAKHYSFMANPEFFACLNFFANCSFSNMCSTTKGIKHYNSLSKDKIKKFTRERELYAFLDSLPAQ